MSNLNSCQKCGLFTYACTCNIRYYKGKHKVRVIQEENDSLYKGYRTVEALDSFIHHGLKLWVPIGSQFSTSTRYLQLLPAKGCETK